MPENPQQVQVTITDPTNSLTTTESDGIVTYSWSNGVSLSIASPIPVVQQVQV